LFARKRKEDVDHRDKPGDDSLCADGVAFTIQPHYLAIAGHFEVSLYEMPCAVICLTVSLLGCRSRPKKAHRSRSGLSPGHVRSQADFTPSGKCLTFI
jgi:hypothetical protein